MHICFFLGCECVEFSSKLVKAAVYRRCIFLYGTLEQSVFHEMCNPLMEPGFILRRPVSGK